MLKGSKHTASAKAKMRAGVAASHAVRFPKFVCSIPGCGKTGFCRGWCAGHYSSNYRHGDPRIANSPEKRAAGIAKMAATKRAHPTRYWLGKKRGPHSAATRAKMSATHRANGYHGRSHHLFGKSLPHRRRIKYRGQLLRSSYELRFAKLLDRGGVRWVYEPKRFDLGTTTYAPDFYLPQYDLYCEVKGWMTSDAKRKIRLFRKLFQTDRLVVIHKAFFTKKLDNKR